MGVVKDVHYSFNEMKQRLFKERLWVIKFSVVEFYKKKGYSEWRANRRAAEFLELLELLLFQDAQIEFWADSEIQFPNGTDPVVKNAQEDFDL